MSEWIVVWDPEKGFVSVRVAAPDPKPAPPTPEQGRETEHADFCGDDTCYGCKDSK